MKILEHRIVPPVPNFKEPDPDLGHADAVEGRPLHVEYAIHLAAGFGSQIALTLTRRIPGPIDRVDDRARYERWLAETSGHDGAKARGREARAAGGRPERRRARPPAASTWRFGLGPARRVRPEPATRVAPRDLRRACRRSRRRSGPPVPTAVPAARRQSGAIGRPAPTAPGGAAGRPPPTPSSEKVLAIVAEKTGYPPDMLEMDLDLEADLGVDTVKQAETFAAVREAYGIPRQENLKLRDFPTLKHVVQFVYDFRPDLRRRRGARLRAAPAGCRRRRRCLRRASALRPAAGDSPGEPASDAVVPEGAGDRGREDRLPAGHAGDGPRPRGRPRRRHGEAGGDVRGGARGLRHRAAGEPEAARLPDAEARGAVRLRLPAGPAPARGVPAPTRPRVRRRPAPARPCPRRPGGQAPRQAGDADAVVQKVLAIVAEKTGYPEDMLEMDLDLEADLGVDTVKQAETFAAVREAYGIPRQENLKLRDFPTLKHVVQFVYDFRPDLRLPRAAATRPRDLPAGRSRRRPRHGGRRLRGESARSDAVVARRSSAIVAEKTGYPEDMLEMDLDLEADLGVDTVKQAETFAAVREAYGIARQENLKLRDFPTLKHVVQFVYDFRPDLRRPEGGARRVAPGGSPAALVASGTRPREGRRGVRRRAPGDARGRGQDAAPGAGAVAAAASRPGASRPAWRSARATASSSRPTRAASPRPSRGRSRSGASPSSPSTARRPPRRSRAVSPAG